MQIKLTYANCVLRGRRNGDGALGYEFFNFEQALEAAVEIEDDHPDRRNGARLRMVYRVARAHARGDQGFARVVNISDHGLMLSTGLEVSIGDEVTVDLSEACSLTGTVVWRTLDQCGLKLTTPIDSVALLSRLKEEQRAPGARQLRLAIDKKVVITTELGMQIVRLRDISQRGAKIVHDGRLRAGMTINVRVTPQLECHGLVRWSLDGQAGVEFEKVLTVSDLGSAKAL
ncbi:PilZ domain-containing protein [Sphingomonas radiodurans]|uniref:PilZ domain-containing protein n=1 Tax=Sphingomonas radiodurans TaxID=2890321 RepID=UPI001E3E93ED|nr:PilZ domain-containing protein [Sphingomonas radiodurans]WBH17450.1 PilZ domain-containing protein [Sphingomonas radiodurans]